METEYQISVVVLGFNERQYLQRCLSAILDQDYPRNQYEVLYIDNGSNDGSFEFVQEQFPEVRAIQLDKNYGFGGGNNRGASFARNRYVAFINSDTIVHRGWLGGMVKAIEHNPQAKACVSGGLAPDTPGFNPSERDQMPAFVYYSDIVRWGHVGLNRIRSDATPRSIMHLAGCSAMVDLSIKDELEYIFDETFFLDGDDTDLGFRINGLGYKVVIAPQSLFYHIVKTLPGELKPSKRTIKRMVNMHRNRFLVYYRNMHTSEFLLALPILLLASPLKPFTFEIPFLRKIAYGLAIIPVTWFAFAQALVTRFPKQVEKRRNILAKRRKGPYWLLSEILTRQQYKE